jgi:hypothetical protein
MSQLPNPMLVVESERDAAGAALPVPLKLIVCGDVAALSVNVTAAL